MRQKEDKLTNIKNAINEFDLTVSAHNGDQEATTILWKRYKRKMMGVIGKYNYRLYQLSNEELESEAAELFMYKLKNVFKPEKVRKSHNEWSFSYMLTGGSRNLRDKIINKSRNYGFYVDEYSEGEGMPECAMEWNDWEYRKYDPEKATIKAEMEKILYQISTPFQKAILEFRQSGMTVQQIADRMGCGFAKVRRQILKVRYAATTVFADK